MVFLSVQLKFRWLHAAGTTRNLKNYQTPFLSGIEVKWDIKYLAKLGKHLEMAEH